MSKILVVDDDPMAVRLIELSLSAEGFEVITAASAMEGLRAVRTERPDLVLLDIMMPDMDGVEMCRHLRDHSDTAHIPIILLSAKTQLDDKIKGLRAGADDYISKPAEPREVVARVEAVLVRAKRASPARRARVIAMMGARGGVGTSTLAVNLAVLLVQRQVLTALMDLHHYAGTIAQQLQLPAGSSLLELLDMEADKIDGSQIEKRLIRHASGLRVLTAPPTGMGRLELPLAHATAIVRNARQLGDSVILDLPHVPSAAVREALVLSDMALLVLGPEVADVERAEQMLPLSDDAGLGSGQVYLAVVNRTQSTRSLPVSEIERRLGRSCLGGMPRASDQLNVAATQGAPLVLAQPNSMAAVSLGEMAERVYAKASSLAL